MVLLYALYLIYAEGYLFECTVCSTIQYKCQQYCVFCILYTKMKKQLTS